VLSNEISAGLSSVDAVGGGMISLAYLCPKYRSLLKGLQWSGSEGMPASASTRGRIAENKVLHLLGDCSNSN